MNEQLQLLDLTQVTITAMVDPTGRLDAVKGLWPKLLAAADVQQAKYEKERGDPDKARFITGCVLPVSGGAELGYRR